MVCGVVWCDVMHHNGLNFSIAVLPKPKTEESSQVCVCVYLLELT